MNKIIISDTSCLIAFDRINQLELLHTVFNSIVTTTSVQEEFGRALPSWIKIEDAVDQHKKMEIEQLVDKGEASAIALALELPGSILIIDEKKGRKIARSLNLQLMGSLKVLLIAKQKGVIQKIFPLIQELESKHFRFSKILIEQILSAANE